MTKRKATKKKAPAKVPLVILSNTQDPALAQVLQTFYQAVHLGQIGLVMGMDYDTQMISPMLAGIEMQDGEIVGVYPLARLMQDTAEIEAILIPDGKGNYVNNDSGFTDPDYGLLAGEAQAESGPTIQ